MKKPIVISGISTTPKNVPSLSEEAPPVVVGIPSKDQSAAYAQEAKTAAELAEKYAEEASQTSQEAVEIHNASPDAHSTLFSQKLTTPEGGLPGQVLVKTEEGEGWGDVSSTSIDGVSGEINLSDGLEIDSGTKTMGIGNASVQSLTIADGGITQNIDILDGGKSFTIGTNYAAEKNKRNYFIAAYASSGVMYLEARYKSDTGTQFPIPLVLNGSVDIRGTAFNCSSAFTQNGVSTFNGTTIFNSDVTASVIRSHDNILHIGNYANLYDSQYANKSYLNIENSGTHAIISAGFFDGNGNRQVAQIHFNSTVWFHKTLASDSIIWAQGEFWSGKLAKFKGSFLTYEEGLANVDLIDSAGRQIFFLDNNEASPTLRIGSRTGATDETKNAREVSIFSRNSGMWSSGGGWFFKGRLFDSTTSTRYTLTGTPEVINATWTFNANAIFNSSISNITGIYQTAKGTKICLGDYVEAPTVADAGKRFLEITNQSSASLATEFSTKVVTSTGSFSSETYSIFKDSFLEGNSITANVNLLVKGASTLRGVSTFNGAVIANAGLTNTTGIFYTPARAIIAMGDVVTNPTIADAGKSWFEIYPFSVTSRLLRGKSINAEGNIISEPLYADSFTLVDQLASEANFALKGQFVTYSTGLTNIDLKDANGRQVIFLDASTSTPILRFGSSANALNTTSNAYEVSLYGRQAGIYTQGSSLVVNSGDLKKMGHGVYTCASLANSITGSWAFNAPQTFNAGIVNTTGTFLLPNKQNRFGQYVENPTIDDASKGWLMLEHSVNTGIDITLYAEYVSSTGSVAGGQIRFGSAVVCNTSLLVFDNADFRSTLRVGGDIRALAGNIITPMSTTPTRIGDYVANPSTADAGKLWIEIAKKDGYIELSGKEVVNTNGTVSVQDYPVRVPGMIRYEELTEAEFAALPRPLPQDVIYRTTQN